MNNMKNLDKKATEALVDFAALSKEGSVKAQEAAVKAAFYVSRSFSGNPALLKDPSVLAFWQDFEEAAQNFTELLASKFELASKVNVCAKCHCINCPELEMSCFCANEIGLKSAFTPSGKPALVCAVCMATLSLGSVCEICKSRAEAAESHSE